MIYKRIFVVFSLLVVVMLIFTACGEATPETIKSSDLIGKTKGAETDTNNEKVSIGRFKQTNITPMEVENGEIFNFSKGKNNECLLSICDIEKEEPKAFTYQDGVWTEKNNAAIVAFIKKDYCDVKAFSDFSGNWWVFYKDISGMDKGYQVIEGGSTKEIPLPTVELSSYVSGFQISEKGFIYLSICGEMDESIGG